jgi:hypothetical protein
MDSGQQDGRLVTQADRSQWQRQAAGALAHIVDRNDWLPGIDWAVSRDGHLSGWTSATFPASQGREAFALWHQALGLGEPAELPGVAGESGRLHATGSWACVPVSLTVRVLPPGTPQPPPETSKAGLPLTYRITQAVHTLEGILEEHPDIPAITWQVTSSGGLMGRAGALSWGGGWQAAFFGWGADLGLEDEAEAPARNARYRQVRDVLIAMTAAAGRTDAHHGHDESLQSGQRRPVAPLLPPRRPGGHRPGPVQAP